MSVTILELERRRDALAVEIAALTKHNQARRFEVAASQRGRATALGLAMTAAFFFSFWLGAVHFPKTRYVTVYCPR